MQLDMILKLLSEEFEVLVKVFDKDDWKFFKFGQGGPYKRTLTHIQKKSKQYDKTILDFFGSNEETASFSKLIVLSLSAADTPKERYNDIDTFRRQLKRMRTVV